MEKVKINPFQLFCLMFLFELGSSIVVGVGLQAKQDAWLAILIGMASGIPLYLIHCYISLQFPGAPFTRCISKIVGKYIGKPLSFIYVLYFFYIASRVLRDFGDLLITTTLNETPLIVVNGLMIVLISYGIYMGIEGIGRTGENVFFVTILLGFLGLTAIFFSGTIKSENLFPFLENGLKPVIATVFTQTYTFPFGEMIAFTMLIPLLNNQRLGKKVGILAILASGLILSVTIALEISIIGTNNAANSQFPLLETVSRVNIANFIQRLDIIVVASLILGMFIKISIFFYAGFLGLQDIFHLPMTKKQRYWVLPIGLLILYTSIKIAGNFTQHIHTGLKWVPIYLHLPLQTGIPILLLIILFLRKLIKSMKTGASNITS